MHPEGGTQGDEDNFFVLMTKGVTVVSSHAHTSRSHFSFQGEGTAKKPARECYYLNACARVRRTMKDEGAFPEPWLPRIPHLSRCIILKWKCLSILN